MVTPVLKFFLAPLIHAAVDLIVARLKKLATDWTDDDDGGGPRLGEGPPAPGPATDLAGRKRPLDKVASIPTGE